MKPKTKPNPSTEKVAQISAEALSGHGYKYQIKEFAALLYRKNFGSPLKYYSDLAQRDEQIKRLKSDLNL